MNNRKKKTYQHTQEHDTKTTSIFGDNNELALSYAELFTPGAIMLRACEKGNIERVKDMLTQGTDPNVTDPSGLGGIYLAAQNGYLDVVKLLLEHKADPNAGLTKDLGTPLHASAKNQHNEIVDALIAAGAKLDVMDKNRITPIMNAVTVNNIFAVEKLLLAGASVEVEGQAVKPIDIAIFRKYEDLARLLSMHMKLQDLKKADPAIASMYTGVRIERSAQFKIFMFKEKPVDGKEPENTKTYQLQLPKA